MNPERRAEIAAAMSAKPFEIIAFEENQPSPGETLVSMRNCGPQWVLAANGKVRKYVPAAPDVADWQPWTVRHLDQAADAEVIPSQGIAPHQWINEAGADRAPIRAWASWRHLAARLGISMAEAAKERPDCEYARRVILDSAWLADEDQAEVAAMSPGVQR